MDFLVYSMGEKHAAALPVGAQGHRGVHTALLVMVAPIIMLTGSMQSAFAQTSRAAEQSAAANGSTSIVDIADSQLMIAGAPGRMLIRDTDDRMISVRLQQTGNLAVVDVRKALAQPLSIAGADTPVPGSLTTSMVAAENQAPDRPTIEIIVAYN